MKRLFLSSLLIGLALQPALAESTSAPRYSMAPVDGGIMRLDGQTGRMSLCAKSGDSYSCKAIEDDRSAFMDELEAMAKENAELKKQLAANSGGSMRLPDVKEFDKALGLMEQMMRRFQGKGEAQPQQQGDKL